jgi:hypothetical protein
MKIDHVNAKIPEKRSRVSDFTMKNGITIERQKSQSRFPLGVPVEKNDT